MTTGSTLPGQVLYGVRAIADFLGIARRQAQHRIDTGELPHFRMGHTICANRSTLTAWLTEQERKGRNDG